MKAAQIFPPGDFLKEELEARNWSQVEFAEIIGRPVRLINEIIAAKKSITPETATQFGESLGTTPDFWMNLESQYQLSKVKKPEGLIQRRAKLYELFPVRDMTRRHWISGSEDIETQEKQCMSFFGTKSLDERPTLAHAAKRTSYESITSAQLAWLFRVRQMAEACAVPGYSKAALIAALPKLHALMVAPEEARHVPKILTEAGVRFVIVEALPGSKIDGACMWLTDKAPVIAMSCRLDRIDNFWFVLRHEIEHLIQEHGKEDQVLFDEEVGDSIEANQLEDEKIANAAAANFCVRREVLVDYMDRTYPYFFGEDRILRFAARIGVHPGIVLGQLHGKTKQYRYLREYLVKIRSFVMKSAPTDGWGNVFQVDL